MEVANRLLTRLICAGLVMALLTPSVAMAQDEKQNRTEAPTVQPSQAAPSSSTPEAGTTTPAETTTPTVEPQPAQTSPDPLPDSPDSVRSQIRDQVQPAAAQNTQRPPQGKVQEPKGTAAAEVESTTGVAASQPTGMAIAPAKQKRLRMVLIKVGALVGAGVAIGSVAALSSASPSRPPGSH
jgi:hypothetical protein